MRNDFESNYLAHAWLSKGQKAQNHKYFERIEQAGKYIYFYTREQYEAWLHRGQKAAEQVKGQVKNAATKVQPKIQNTRQGMTNAINAGTQAVNNSIAKSKTMLTKSNANQIIDRGNKAVSSILNTTSKTTKDVSSKAMNVASNLSKNIQNNTRSITAQARNTVDEYASKGKKKVDDIIKKAKSIDVNEAVNRFTSAGQQMLAPIIVAATNVKDTIYKTINAKKPAQQEAERRAKLREENQGRKAEIEARNKARAMERSKEGNKFKNADDSAFEDLVAHTDIRQKKEETTRDEDMKAVNQMSNITPEEFQKKQEYYNEYYNAMMKYYSTGDPEDYKKALEAFDKYSDIYNKYYGYLNNCANCTLTYDLRRRGYDVDAPWNQEGTYHRTVWDWYKMSDSDIDTWDSDSGDYKGFSKQEADDIVNDIKTKYPEGSYGHFQVQWQHPGTDASAGGHDCVWSIENGKVIIRDCQTNQIVEPQKYLQNSYTVSYFRADDKELNDSAYAAAKTDIIDINGDDRTTDKDYVAGKQMVQTKGKDIYDRSKLGKSNAKKTAANTVAKRKARGKK